MPRIPLGDFGNRVAEVGLTPTAQPDNQIGNAFQHLAGTGVAVADQALTEIDRQQRVQKAQDDALARSNAADGLIQYQVQSRQATQDIKDQIQTGQLPYTEARGVLDNALSGIKPPTFGPSQNLVAKE